jgi:DNA polymerase I
LGDDKRPESRYKVEECCFNTIFGAFEGHKIYADRKVAEKVEIQTHYAAELYNVDVKQINDIWPRKTFFHAETKKSQGRYGAINHDS